MRIGKCVQLFSFAKLPHSALAWKIGSIVTLKTILTIDFDPWKIREGAETYRVKTVFTNEMESLGYFKRY